MNEEVLISAGLSHYKKEDFYPKKVTLRKGKKTTIWVHNQTGHGLLDPENWVSDDYYEEEYREQFSANCNGQKNLTEDHFKTFKNLNEKQFSKFHKFIKPNTKFLEVGSSHGGLLEHVVDKAAICHTVEPNKEDADFLRARYPSLEIYNSLLEDALIPEEYYDVAVSFEVLEHTINPSIFLKKLNNSLKKAGALILEVPNHNDALLSCYNENTNYKDFYYHQAHVHYFTPASLEDICTQSGFVGEVDSFLMYPFFNHVYWYFNSGPQANASIALSTPEPTKNMSEAQFRINNFYKKVTREYEKIINSSMVGDCLIYKGFKK